MRPMSNEPGAWFLIAFMAGGAAARGITKVRHSGREVWPFRETVTPSGTHVHHGDWALGVLLAAAAASTVVDGHRRTVAAVLGAATGVFADELPQFVKKRVDPADYDHPAVPWVFAAGATAIGAGLAFARSRRRVRGRAA